MYTGAIDIQGYVGSCTNIGVVKAPEVTMHLAIWTQHCPAPDVSCFSLHQADCNGMVCAFGSSKPQHPPLLSRLDTR